MRNDINIFVGIFMVAMMPFITLEAASAPTSISGRIWGFIFKLGF